MPSLSISFFPISCLFPIICISTIGFVISRVKLLAIDRIVDTVPVSRNEIPPQKFFLFLDHILTFGLYNDT